MQRLIVGGSYTQSDRATVADGAGAGGSANEVEILHHSAVSAGHCLSLHNKDEEKKNGCGHQYPFGYKVQCSEMF